MRVSSTVMVIAALAAWSMGCGGGGGNEGDPDTSADTQVDTSDVITDTTPDTGEDTSPDLPEDVQAEEDAVEDVTVEDVEEEEVVVGCGDGTLDTASGEVCDDGNRINEQCDTTDTGACLADCSLAMSECGDGSPDDGEQCDDGDLDSLDDCTTSCTTNDHYIGAPCTCTDIEGGECASVDFTAGLLTGCEDLVADADLNRELACLRTLAYPAFGLELYFPEGYCTLLAFTCAGALCTGFRDVGNVAAFTCPAGYAVVTQVQDIFGTIITTKSCHPECTSHADCRWNAEEEDGTCGRYACLPAGDGGEMICADERLPIE